MSSRVSRINRSLQPLRGQRVLVMGLGRFGGGVGVTRWLVGQGAIVTVTDQAEADQLADSIDALADLDVRFHLGGHDVRDLDTTDLALVNPAVNKARSKFFQTIVHRKIAWTTEINLFCERCPATVIGVSGSYGKSTTCAMIVHALSAFGGTRPVAFKRVYLGGNIGRSLLNELAGMSSDDLVVLELSSSQLEDLPRIEWIPHIAVITNLLPHHLDRYGSFEAYAAAKLNIIQSSNYASKVVLGPLDEEAAALVAQSLSSATHGVHRVTRSDCRMEISLPGEHNRVNAACALAVCRLLEVDESVARDALRSFVGLPHRLEHVRTLDAVDYINDSKSTSPAATLTAIKTVDRPIVAIVGGQAGEVPAADWARIVVQACRVVICTGEAGQRFAAILRETCDDGQIPIHESETLADAVRLARQEAQPGNLVLFSPGAPSFDSYPNFAARGRDFVELVNAL